MNNIGTRIRELRQEHNLVQQQLATGIGVAKAMISFWENGINEPKASNIIALAMYFDVSCGYLLGVEDEYGNIIQGQSCTNAPHVNHAEEELVRHFRQLDEVKQRNLIELIK